MTKLGPRRADRAPGQAPIHPLDHVAPYPQPTVATRLSSQEKGTPTTNRSATGSTSCWTTLWPTSAIASSPST